MPDQFDDSFRDKGDDDYRRKDDHESRPHADDDYRRRDDDDDDDYDRPRRRDYVEPHRGTMILVFGILGVILCAVFAPIAWVMGSSDLKAIAAGRMDREGEGMTRAGYILGIIGTILLILGILLSCLWIALFAAIASQRH